jgi:hypothetical protein
MTLKIITNFGILMRYAKAEADAKKEYVYACDLHDKDKKIKARKKYDDAVDAHEDYRQMCLNSDEMMY